MHVLKKGDGGNLLASHSISQPSMSMPMSTYVVYSLAWINSRQSHSLGAMHLRAEFSAYPFSFYLHVFLRVFCYI